MDSNMNLKLIDFGLCSTTYCNVMKDKVGTPGYIAPEVIIGVEYSEKCDVFSLGVCLYVMRKGVMPFRAQSHDSLLLISQIQELQFGCEFSNELVDLIRKMIEPRQSERIDLLEIGNHQWMAGFSCASKAVVPKPIQFFRINELSDILKFRRMFVSIDPEILRKTCEFLGVGEDQKSLREALKDGLMTEETTVYYLMSCPCREEPRIPRPPVGAAAQVGVRGRRKIEAERAVKQRERSPKNSTPKIRRPEASPRAPRVRMFL